MNAIAQDLIAHKHLRLTQILREMSSVVVAFSAGVDSTLVLKVAIDTLGPANVLAATGVSPSLAARELQSVKSLAQILEAPLELINTQEVSNAQYAANPANRCYYCKTELYAQLASLAQRRNFKTILNGVNTDDLGDFRPGLQAAREWNVRAPLVEAGLSKTDVRALAQRLGLPNWQKPALACLSSRVPYGTPVTVGILSQIEKAEAYLYEHGFSNFRVRHHQKLARLEVAPADISRLLAEPLRSQVINTFKDLGYTYIAVDLQGFRSGSGNEVLGHTRKSSSTDEE